MLSRDLQTLRNKLLTLAVINVLQPVERSFLIEQLESIVDTDHIDYILDELIKEKSVTIEKNHFRLTHKGMKVMIPRKGRTLRDMQRMEYLVQLSKQRGGS